MAKIKLTKNELKKQKDALKRFRRYLPTLQLKKQQLQMEVRKIEEMWREKDGLLREHIEQINAWVSVLGEEVGLENLVVIKTILTEESNIAGVDIPVFKDVEFESITYDLFTMPLWVDRAIAEIKELIRQKTELAVLRKQLDLLREELTVTTQRVNLFEKVKIPETRENIRVIQIYMGDQQTAAVVRGKISKKALVAKQQG